MTISCSAARAGAYTEPPIDKRPEMEVWSGHSRMKQSPGKCVTIDGHTCVMPDPYVALLTGTSTRYYQHAVLFLLKLTQSLYVHLPCIS